MILKSVYPSQAMREHRNQHLPQVTAVSLPNCDEQRGCRLQADERIIDILC